MTIDTVVPVRMEMETIQLPEKRLLYIMDTASSTSALPEVLGKGYAELTAFIRSNQLMPENFMAWYYATQAPWPMDIAVSVDQLPESTEGRIHKRLLAPSKAVVIHMWGPYEQAAAAYEKIGNWLMDNKIKAKGHPYEIYLNDPAQVAPTEIRTDIIQEIE